MLRVVSVGEAIAIIEDMSDEVRREARYAVRERDRIALNAKGDAMDEAARRLKTGIRDPRWHLAQAFPP